MTNELKGKKLGPYLLLDQIGRGGMSEIYKAKAPHMENKMVVLKVIRKEYMYDSDFINLLKSEAETVTKLHHKNLVEVYSFSKHKDLHFIAMEYVEGTTLKKLFSINWAKESLLPVSVVCFVTREVCEALSFLYNFEIQKGKKLGILHTDLADRNILMGLDGSVKLIDFSVEQTALNIKSMVTEGAWGQMGEMAPERLKGDPFDVTSDIFQLGIMLHIHFLGYSPFGDKRGFHLYAAIREINVTEDKLPDSLNPELKKILVKALAREPKDRFQSAVELGDSLAQFMEKHYPNFSAQDISTYVKQTLQKNPA